MLTGSHCTEHTTTTTAASLAVYVNRCLRQLPSYVRLPPVVQTKTSDINISSPFQRLFELQCIAVGGVTALIP